jgi:hypothetical protein
MTSLKDEITDEMLVAFADGEADEALAERIETALEADEALAKRLEVFVTTRTVLKRSFDHVAREPVPEKLMQFVMSNGRMAGDDAAKPAVSPALRRAASRWGQGQSWSMAAAFALAVGIGGYFMGTLQRGGAPVNGSFAALAGAEPVLAEKLTSTPDGATIAFKMADRTGEIALRESFRTRQGYCRTFGVTDGATKLGGVACRTEQGWRTEVATAEGESIGGYAPASGMAKAVEAFLDAAEAEDPLAAEAVREKITAGWK